ncbi:PepSY domain-containing protein [Nocardia sp. CDC159]|uniref:PepSY domain-containing protein n=1 Tax=Nocardia pulmonis TaxID=2951408 RepID=A0A9X2E4H6_9NOCA|nr:MULTISPECIES: PepSY domain-containing protein [Nocardia]MCM6773987.1 PepSY domain-containing protein [Nocardia pulmonis]MCM6786874.1 PepSY domain-containing protein [Nocardia sp. CDC159]
MRATLLTAGTILALTAAGCGDDSSPNPTTAPATTPLSATTSQPGTTVAQPPVSRQQAEQAALATVPGGRVTSAELGDEHGRQVWEFEIADPQGAVHHVDIDATTAAVVPHTDHDRSDN